MNPIYPDKSKTGLAALKPLLIAYCDDIDRWKWEQTVTGGLSWYDTDVIEAVGAAINGDLQIRLTPKPRRAWIGDQWYWEPVESVDGDEEYSIADITNNVVRKTAGLAKHFVLTCLQNDLVFSCPEHAQQCLDAHRRARRVE